MNHLKIIIADKQETYRYSIKKLLEQIIETKIVAEPETARQLIDALKEVKADLVIIDVNLPYFREMHEIICTLESAPSIKVIATSLFEEDETSQCNNTLQKIQNYRGFLLKPTEKTRLEPIVKEITAKELDICTN